MMAPTVVDAGRPAAQQGAGASAETPDVRGALMESIRGGLKLKVRERILFAPILC